MCFAHAHGKARSLECSSESVGLCEESKRERRCCHFGVGWFLHLRAKSGFDFFVITNVGSESGICAANIFACCSPALARKHAGYKQNVNLYNFCCCQWAPQSTHPHANSDVYALSVEGSFYNLKTVFFKATTTTATNSSISRKLLLRALSLLLLLLLLLTLLLNLMLSIRISELNLIIMIVFLAVYMLKHSNFPTSHTRSHTHTSIRPYLHSVSCRSQADFQRLCNRQLYRKKSKTKYKLRKVDKSAGHNYVHTFVWARPSPSFYQRRYLCASAMTDRTTAATAATISIWSAA